MDDNHDNRSDEGMRPDTNGLNDRIDEREYNRKMAIHRRRVAERRRKRRRQAYIYRGIALLVLALVIILGVIGVRAAVKHFKGLPAKETTVAVEETTVPEETTAPAISEMDALIAQTDRLAAMYDYENAAVMLSESPYKDEQAVIDKINAYTVAKDATKPVDNLQVTHIFFHALIIDVNRALTADKLGTSFNSAMCTKEEFERVLEEMYNKGYVLVRLHDMGEITTSEDGTETMVKKQIMLPEGKIPFVLSEDDVNYYEYMTGHGFATRMVLDEEGKPTYEYTDADGNTTTGDYDIVPILDKFVEEHPDFSYRGAKAILAFTGYNGVLGYRTDETYDVNSPNRDNEKPENPNIEADKETVKKLTQVLKDDGYEFASHSWGHINMTDSEIERVTKDTDRWERNVEPLLPDPCDILIYPFGADIEDWHAYTNENAKFDLFEKVGFRYFCNVDSSQYWVQYGSNFIRQGRRDIDGFRLYEAYSGEKDRVSDLFDVQKIFDTRRPTPIGWDY